MSKILIAFVVVVLMVCNVFQMWRYDNWTEQCMTMIRGMKERTLECDYYEMQLKCNINNIGTGLDSIKISDTNQNELCLGDIITTRTLLCKMSDANCHSCNEYALNILNDCIDSLHIQNIVYLYEADNKRIFTNDVKQMGLADKNAFRCEQTIKELDDINFPYFIEINERCEVTMVHVPFKSMREQDRNIVSAMMKGGAAQ